MDILKISDATRAVNQRGQKPGLGKIKELEISPKFLIQFLISSPLIF
jgi:hypothetical protein